MPCIKRYIAIKILSFLRCLAAATLIVTLFVVVDPLQFGLSPFGNIFVALSSVLIPLVSFRSPYLRWRLANIVQYCTCRILLYQLQRHSWKGFDT